MQTFSYVKAPSIDKALAERAAGEVHCRRHHARRPDETERRDTQDTGRHQSAAAGQDREAARRRTAHRRAGAQFGSRVERRSAEDRTPCCRRRFFPARRRSCATWQRPAATCCNARAACTSASPVRERRAAMDATSVRRARVARRWTASTARTLFWARASTVSRLIPRTCAWPWRLSKR